MSPFFSIISEAYGMTRIPKLKTAMERGVELILKGQQGKGGWDYGYAKGTRRDTSIVGWHIQALKAAYLAGAENAGIKEAMKKAIEDLTSIYNEEKGSFGYTEKGGRNDAMTGVGALCFQLLGHADTPQVKGARTRLRMLHVTGTTPFTALCMPGTILPR